MTEHALILCREPGRHSTLDKGVLGHSALVRLETDQTLVPLSLLLERLQTSPTSVLPEATDTLTCLLEQGVNLE